MALNKRIAHMTLLVKDYDEAIEYFTISLGFKLLEDTRRSESKRWVLVSPNELDGTNLLLAKAATPEQESVIGRQAGGRVFMFLQTDDFWRDYKLMKSKGVNFLEEPRDEEYGTVAVFCDLYGNKWDLLEMKKEE
ncbi:MAG: VOC family protein [Syntrophothermus sp.]